MDPWYRVATPRKKVREGRSFNPDEFAIAPEQVVAGTAPEEVEDAHKEFSKKGKELGISELRELQTNGRAHFLLSDVSKNWWEITS